MFLSQHLYNFKLYFTIKSYRLLFKKTENKKIAVYYKGIGREKNIYKADLDATA